jgi:hypothetical protein
MLQKLTEEIAECYANASHCRKRAKEAVDPFWTWNGAGYRWPTAMNLRNDYRISPHHLLKANGRSNSPNR